MLRILLYIVILICVWNLLLKRQEFSFLPVRLMLYALVAVALLFFSQDFFIYPGAVTSYRFRGDRPAAAIPPDVTHDVVKTSDGESIEVWRMKSPNERATAILFHGNGDTNESFYAIQRWLADIGFSSYSFNYRGYGYSSGWPSEQGLYNDALAVWKLAVERDKVTSDRLFVLGVSLGAAPASWLAAKMNPPLLVLLAPFESLRKRAKEEPVLGFMAPLVRGEYPVGDYVSRLTTTKVLLIHGHRDGVIPVKHGEKVASSYRGTAGLTAVFVPEAGHNDLLDYAAPRLEAELHGFFPAP